MKAENISLPTVYTQPSLPVAKDQSPTQEDVSRWPYLYEVVIPVLDADIGILIGGNICSTDPRDLDYLSPNHLLLLKDQPSLPLETSPGVTFTPDGAGARSST